MDDLYSILLDDDDASAQARAQALARAMRGQSTMGNLWQLSGDKVLGQVGQGLTRSAEQQGAAGMEAFGQRLKRAMDRQSLAQSQAEFEDANAPAAGVYHDLARKFGTRLADGVTNRQAKEQLALAERAYAAEQRAQEIRQNREAMRAGKEDAATARREKETREGAEKLSKRTEDTVGVVSSLKTLNSLLGPEGFETTQEVPGIGVGQGMLDVVPFGNLLRSDKGKDVRAAAKDLSANVLRAYSGAAASDRELLRTLERLGQGDYSDDREFLQAIKRVRSFVAEQRKNAEAGAGPDATELFRQQGGETSDIVGGIGQGTAAPEAVAPPDTVPMVSKKGKRMNVPLSQVKEAEGRGWTRQ